jgi:hypothetical protein
VVLREHRLEHLTREPLLRLGQLAAKLPALDERVDRL